MEMLRSWLRLASTSLQLFHVSLPPCHLFLTVRRWIELFTILEFHWFSRFFSIVHSKYFVLVFGAPQVCHVHGFCTNETNVCDKGEGGGWSWHILAGCSPLFYAVEILIEVQISAPFRSTFFWLPHANTSSTPYYVINWSKYVYI